MNNKPGRKNGDTDRVWYPDVPVKSSRMKPMAPIGTPCKVFRLADEDAELNYCHSGINCLVEHERNHGKGKSSYQRKGGLSS